jgi:hypothetical protein
MSLKKFCPFHDKPCMEGACMFWDVIDYYEKIESVVYGTDIFKVPKTEVVFGCLIQKAVKRYAR